MKKSILLATSAIIAAGAFTVDAQAVDVELYGQVNKGVMGYSVDNNSEIAIVDNDVSSTRFGLRGEQQLDHGLTASVLMEVEFNNDNASNLVVQPLNNGATTDTAAVGFQERHARVGLAGQWGALFVGRTSSATDGITEIDLGPVADVLNSATDRIGGGLNAGGAGTISALTDNMDGIGYTEINAADQHGSDRANLVRFDTPIVEGFQGRVAYVQGGDIDASVLYNGKYDAYEIAAGVGVVSYEGADTPDTPLANVVMHVDKTYAGSVSVKHDSGVSFTGAYGTRTLKNTPAGMDNPTFWYAKAGYQMGNTGFAIDYAKHTDGDLTNATIEKVNAYGIGVQQDLGHGVSASAYYRTLKVADRAVTTEEDVDVYGVNMRVKF